MAIETPKYKVLKKDRGIELRRYSGYITASTEIISTDYNAATNQGFSYVADYIFGNNSKKDRVAMTSPVLQEAKSVSEKIAMTAPVSITESNNKYKISFVMPSRYTLKSLPLPNNQKVVLTKVPPFKAAVKTFSGFVNKKIIKMRTEELKKWIKQENLNAKDLIQVARYDPPWTPWFLRRNEIIISIV